MSEKSAALSVLKIPLSSLLSEQGRRVQAGQTELAVFLLSNGEVRALENRCPHKGGSLAEGIVGGEYVFCTQHDWKICMNDGEAQAPDKGCTRTFKAWIEGDDAVIELSHPGDGAPNLTGV